MQSTQESVRPVLYQRSHCDLEYRQDLGQSRRIIERFHADPEFRTEVREGRGREAAARLGVSSDPEDLRPLWDREASRPLAEVAADPQAPLSLRRHCSFTQEKIEMRTRYRTTSSPVHPIFRAWRERQVVRGFSQMGPIKGDNLVHAPFAVELGHGCSVGCWFCGVSADRLGEQARHTPEMATLWRDCLEALGEIFGPAAAAHGFCYWATDPLDNPDYEDYLIDFHEVLGYFPQTTTAQPQKHVERVKALLQLSESRGGLIDRFSVLTLKQWNQIHESFSPAELTFVECIPQNKEALHPGKSVAGRALDANRKRAAKGLEEPANPLETSTVACVTGFLINLQDRYVRLITPCNANERWPLGYWVLGQGNFTDGRSFAALLQELIGPLKESISHDRALRFRPDLTFSALDDGFEVRSHYETRTFRNPSPALRKLGEFLSRGPTTSMEAALHLDSVCPWEETFYWLNLMLEHAVLDEEPDGGQDVRGGWIPLPVQPA